jgi:hypothetical protein
VIVEPMKFVHGGADLFGGHDPLVAHRVTKN